MEFDKSKVYSVVNAVDVGVGSIGFVADNMAELKNKVARDDSFLFTRITDIKDESYTSRFVDENFNEYPLFYLLKEPEEVRPYNDTDEMISHYLKHFNLNLTPPSYKIPDIWIKHTGTGDKYKVTSIKRTAVGIDIGYRDVQSLSEFYTYLDGTPCGIKEE